MKQNQGGKIGSVQILSYLCGCNHMPGWSSAILVIVIAILVLALITNRLGGLTGIRNTLFRGPSADCRIKGNVSANGTKTYHIPGGEWYERTKIDAIKGERWFCSEEVARSAGWRKSLR